MSQILDQFGRPFTPVKRPETRELAAVSIRDRWSSYPTEGLTPARMREILRTADYGWQREQMELFEEMEEKDTHLASILQTRKLALTGMRWDIQADGEAPADVKIADFVREQLAGISDFQDDLLDLLDAIGKGFSVVEILWRVDAGANQVGLADLRWIHPKRISFLNQMVLRILTDDEPTAGVEPKPWQVIFHRYRARSGLSTRGGVLRTVALPYLLKNYALKDWAAFNEVFGMPLRLGKYDVSATPADRAALAQALRSLGTDAAGIISANTQIEFVEAGLKAGGAMIPYHVLFQAMNAEMSKAVLGQTLTSDTGTGGRGGSLAMARVHDEVRTDLRDADAAALSRTLKDQLLRPLVGFNFGWDAPVPQFVLLTEDSPDLKSDSEMVKNLVDAGAGACIPAGYINDHFGIPVPEDGAETLKAAPPPPPPLAPSGPGLKPAAPEAPAEPPAPEAHKAVLTLREVKELLAEGASPEEISALMAVRRTILTLKDGGKLELIPQDKEALDRIKELDDLADQAAAAAETEIMRLLAPVREMIAGGQALEEIKGELLKLYSQIEVEGLVTLIHEARMRAFMKGRLGE
jgi:phage gp29-like protein